MHIWSPARTIRSSMPRSKSSTQKSAIVLRTPTLRAGSQFRNPQSALLDSRNLILKIIVDNRGCESSRSANIRRIKAWRISQNTTSDAAVAAQKTNYHHQDLDIVRPAANAVNNSSLRVLRFGVGQSSYPVKNARQAIRSRSKRLTISRCAASANHRSL